jgi:hypothetical protein
MGQQDSKGRGRGHEATCNAPVHINSVAFPFPQREVGGGGHNSASRQPLQRGRDKSANWQPLLGAVSRLAAISGGWQVSQLASIGGGASQPTGSHLGDKSANWQRERGGGVRGAISQMAATAMHPLGMGMKPSFRACADMALLLLSMCAQE